MPPAIPPAARTWRTVTQRQPRALRRETTGPSEPSAEAGAPSSPEDHTTRRTLDEVRDTRRAHRLGQPDRLHLPRTSNRAERQRRTVIARVGRRVAAHGGIVRRGAIAETHSRPRGERREHGAITTPARGLCALPNRPRRSRRDQKSSERSPSRKATEKNRVRADAHRAECRGADSRQHGRPTPWRSTRARRRPQARRENIAAL